MSSHARWLILIVILSLFCIWVATPPEFKGVESEACAGIEGESVGLKCSENLEIDLNGDGEYEFVLNITQSLGLDLVGGLRVLLQADVAADSFYLRRLGRNGQQRVAPGKCIGLDGSDGASSRAGSHIG